jgi:hypothetical protein
VTGPAAVLLLLLALLAVSLPALQAQTFFSNFVATTPLPRLRVGPGPALTPRSQPEGEEPRAAAAQGAPADDIPFLRIPTVDAEGAVVNTSTRAAVQLRAPVPGRQYIPPNAASRPTDLVRIRSRAHRWLPTLAAALKPLALFVMPHHVVHLPACAGTS